MGIRRFDFPEGINYSVKLNDILEKLSKLNPLNLLNLRTYEYKFKNFLRSLALGMKPTVPWDVKVKLMEVF
ncbi:hypothetical protein TEQUI_0222 [Taylorella equigenitalis MCE9]|uniref:Uncharacterized protein n=1 Tax=Taylorella equigenitalis (strain MCE9) TaxID=937774 RepID=A0A654KFL7_TAYEM|nr:hypothetical protein TEQUI_0222 [Taylorella equigenitalis MCE9]